MTARGAKLGKEKPQEMEWRCSNNHRVAAYFRGDVFWPLKYAAQICATCGSGKITLGLKDRVGI